MNILIGMECSGITRDAFIKAGHNAISCDMLPSEIPGPHLQCDVYKAMRLLQWDMIILHPVCTYMSVSGNRWYTGTDKRKQAEIDTLMLWQYAKQYSKHIAMENPVSTLSKVLGKAHQTIQPWQFGHGEVKAICWWLYGLPPLKPTRIVSGRKALVHRMPPGATRTADRARWYPGIAKAQAQQWGSYITRLDSAVDQAQQ